MSVAEAIPHDAATLHVTGQARYVDDIPSVAGTLHLCFGLSRAAHGRIVSLDLRPVHQAPGVVAVLTAADLQHANDVSPSIHDEPLLADGAVHYMGQPIFLVIAESHLAARRAARRAEVEIEPLPRVLTIEEALAAGSRFEEGPRVYRQGDPDAAIGRSPRRLSGRVTLGGQEHF